MKRRFWKASREIRIVENGQVTFEGTVEEIGNTKIDAMMNMAGQINWIAGPNGQDTIERPSFRTVRV